MDEKRLVDGTTALAEKRPRVIKIEPAERPQNVRLRVAAYTRVSSDSEDQLNSFAAQNRYYTELISGKAEWRMVDIYADEGITGTSVAKRDDFQRMMADCRRGLIDQILVKSISRFARNTNAVVSAAFYGTELSASVPEEYRMQLTQMRGSFSHLDAAVAEANQKAEGNSLDPIQVKSVFFALCFGEDALSQSDAEAFVVCFYETETRVREEAGETYEVSVPLPMEEVYAQLSVWRGRAVTAEERSNAVKIYSMVMGSAGSGTFNGAYEPGGNAPMELEASMFTDPATKNSADLAIYAASAWNSGWGYVWGTFGQVLTPELLQYKISQYPEGVGDEADFIRSHWLNRRTTDCVGLIKGYGWLNTETMEIQYGSNGMPDVGADGMYYNAGRKGSIEAMPDTPGLAVWKSGHIGVYIGNGEVIEAMDTRYGVVKTKLQGRGWSHWLEVPGIKYD